MKECPKFLLELHRTSIVDGFSGMQETLGVWQKGAHPQGQTPLEQYIRTSEETFEAAQEVFNYDGSPESVHNLTEECADVIIGFLGIVIAAGGNLAPVLGRKLETMFEKYDVQELSALHAQGIPPLEAMRMRKTLWSADA